MFQNAAAKAFVTLSAAACLSPFSLWAAAPVTTTSIESQVQLALKSEANPDSTSVDRRTLLHPAVNPESATSAAWWQSGFVKSGSGWRHAEIPFVDSDAVLQEYRTQRAATPKTASGQLKLADWCRDHKLPDQERAHLTQVVYLSNPADCAAIFRRMGYRQIGFQWASPAELQAMQDSFRDDEEHYREWRAAIERIARNWIGNAKQRKLAADELTAIHSAKSIPALMTAVRANESLAVAICKQLDTMSSYEAAQALATIAVQSESPTVRQSASDLLRTRKVDDFAPALLREMRSPFATSSANVANSTLIVREEANRYLAVDIRLIPIPVSGALTLNFNRRLQRFMNADSAIVGLVATDRSRLAADFQHAVEQMVEAENDRTEEFNKRASDVMATATGQEASTNPGYWWAWWQLHTGSEAIPKKHEVLKREVLAPSAYRVVIGSSCLVAGTPVWTDRGQIAVDQVEVGDKVLAKDIKTGEIHYQPVLRTTSRQPAPVTRFTVGGTTIVANHSHHFWVSGTGWTKTRDLKPGQPIHTALGMSRIESVEENTGMAPVYNLVVADNHTYFIGPAMLLSHDVSQPQPTDIKVPGLPVE